MSILTVLFLFIGIGSTDPIIEKDNTSDEFRAEATFQSLIASTTYLLEEEKAMLWEINLVRTEPSAYIPWVEEVLAEIMADSVRLSAIVSESIKRRVTLVDGVEVVEVDTTYRNYYEDRLQATRELLIELSSAVPMPGLVPYQPLYETAVTHASSQAPSNYIDHVGHDGRWPQDRILDTHKELVDANENIARGVGSPREILIQLLIDSGVDHRGHRKNILNPEWRYVTCHHVRQLDQGDLKWWIQEFAF